MRMTSPLSTGGRSAALGERLLVVVDEDAVGADVLEEKVPVAELHARVVRGDVAQRDRAAPSRCRPSGRWCRRRRRKRMLLRSPSERR